MIRDAILQGVFDVGITLNESALNVAFVVDNFRLHNFFDRRALCRRPTGVQINQRAKGNSVVQNPFMGLSPYLRHATLPPFADLSAQILDIV